MTRRHNNIRPFRTTAQKTPSGETQIARYYQVIEGIPVRLNSGSSLYLPYSDFIVKNTSRRRGLWQREIFVSEENAKAIDYKTLPKLARRCIQQAQRAAEQGRARTDTLPVYRRLAIGPAQGQTQPPQLYSALARDGISRFADQQTAVITSPQAEKVAASGQLITEATHVNSSYMVVPLNGKTLENATYRNAEPNIFGPGEQDANAFWISGPALAIHADQDPGLMRRNPVSLVYEPRYLVVPTEFYMVT